MARRASRSPLALLEIVKRLNVDIEGLGLVRPSVAGSHAKLSPENLYDALISSAPLRSATRKLFLDGHFAEAVEGAYKCVNNLVKTKSGIADRDGQDLMLHVFDPLKPVLKLNYLRTTSERDEQAGYRFILAGSMTGIRNPRAHAHDLSEEPEIALELLVMANHLAWAIAKAKKSRLRSVP